MTTRGELHRGDTTFGSAAGHEPTAEIFRIEVRPDRDRVLVCPTGEVDLATANILEDQVLELLQSGFDRVVIDLRGVTFIDSTGIRALLSAHQRARNSLVAVSIIPGSPTTRRLFELTGIDDYLELENGQPNGAPWRDGTS